GFDAHGHQPYGRRADEKARDQRAVAAPLGQRRAFAVIERLSVLVLEIPADQLALAVPREPPRQVRQRVVDAGADERDGHAARISAGRDRRLVRLDQLCGRCLGQDRTYQCARGDRMEQDLAHQHRYEFAGTPAVLAATLAATPTDAAMKSAIAAMSSS